CDRAVTFWQPPGGWLFPLTRPRQPFILTIFPDGASHEIGPSRAETRRFYLAAAAGRPLRPTPRSAVAHSTPGRRGGLSRHSCGAPPPAGAGRLPEPFPAAAPRAARLAPGTQDPPRRLRHAQCRRHAHGGGGSEVESAARPGPNPGQALHHV